MLSKSDVTGMTPRKKRAGAMSWAFIAKRIGMNGKLRTCSTW